MRPSSRIWAKSQRGNRSPVSLQQHVADLQRVAEHFSQFGWIPDDLKQDLNRVIRWHDLGKVLPFFQIVIVKNPQYSPREPFLNVPHALASLLLIPSEALPPSMLDRKILLSAVAYHHWRERYADILSRQGNVLHELAQWLMAHPQVWESLKKNIQEAFEESTDFGNDSLVQYFARNGAVYEVAPPPYRLYFAPIRETIPEEDIKRWILLAGWLQRVDHFASYMEEAEDNVQATHAWMEGMNSTALKENILLTLQKSVQNSVTLWQEDYAKKGSRVVVAPTGMGKTELGLLWAANNGKQMIYTLPLRVATEQIYQRVRGYVGTNRVGLLHGDADLFLLTMQRDAGAHEEEAFRVLDLARHFGYPYIIATGDQFFPYVLRPPGYERIYASFPHTALVMDEVQAYDPVASAMVVKYAEDVARMGGRVLVITATLPGYIQKALEERIRVYDPSLEVKDLFEDPNYRDRLNTLYRHRVKVVPWITETNSGEGRYPMLKDLTQQIVEEAQEGRKVLVVANTVKRARAWFQQIDELARGEGIPVDLLHSGFTQNDRREKEKAMASAFDYTEKGPRVLVATQVVEASLDLDADVLFTELAPMDALVQRMGRVFRRYRIQGDKIWNRAENREVIPDELPPDRSNVYVLVEEQALASGAGPVYDVDLLGITLGLVLGEDPEEIGAWMDKKRKRKADTWWKEWVKNLPEKESVWSEKDKHQRVVQLYDLLEKQGHRHIRQFEDTLGILDAGYMSDRRSEAHWHFRRISQVQGVPEDQQSCFVDAVKKFFKREEKHSYVRFKEEVLSKFVVSSYVGDEREELIDSVRKLLGEMKSEDARRLSRWIAGLWVLPGGYDQRVGFDKDKKSRPDSKMTEKRAGQEGGDSAGACEVRFYSGGG